MAAGCQPHVGFGLMAPTLMASEACNAERLADAAAIADDSPIDTLWVGDHLLFRLPVLSSVATLGFLAARTRRVKLGTNVLQLPLHGPAFAAQAIGTIAFLTDRPVILGVGVGGEYQPEWEAAGVDPHQRGQRCDEALRMLEPLWSGHAMQGDYYTAPGVPVDPSPPPGSVSIWIGGRSEAAYRRASRHDGFLAYLQSPRRFAETRTRILHLAEPRRDLAFGIQIMTRIDSRHENALRTAREALSRIYALNGPEFDRYVAAGPPSQIAEYVAAYLQSGATHVSFFCLGPDWPTQAKRLTTEVLPLLSAGH